MVLRLQVGYKIAKREKHLKKPERGHCEKAGTPWLRHLVEFKVKTPEQLDGMDVGSALELESMFEVDQLVDIAGTSIGKGFQGTIKRWGHHRGLMTHGARLPSLVPGAAVLCFVQSGSLRCGFLCLTELARSVQMPCLWCNTRCAPHRRKTNFDCCQFASNGRLEWCGSERAVVGVAAFHSVAPGHMLTAQCRFQVSPAARFHRQQCRPFACVPQPQARRQHGQLAGHHAQAQGAVSRQGAQRSGCQG